MTDNQITWADFIGKNVKISTGILSEIVRLHHVEDAGIIIESKEEGVLFIPWHNIYWIRLHNGKS